MYSKIMVLHPTAINGTGFRLQDKGAGVFISFWDTAKLGAKPTKAELDAVAVQATQLENMIAVRAERDRLLKIADIDFNKAVDAGLSTTAIGTYRQNFRDLPTNFPNADMATFDWTMV